MPRISLIVAYDRQRGIGKDNGMPWHLPGELAYFKATTMGKPLIMGRNTHESIGRALPGRRNIVVTSRQLSTPGIECTSSLDQAIALCHAEPEAMVIGGGQLYRAALPLATRIFATEIDGDFAADTHFPPIAPDQWRETRRERRAADERNPFAFDLVAYDRV
jgi:dihydrofolate reductase